MPKALVRWRTNSSSSTKVPWSSSCSMRSRAVFLPFACCFSIAAAPLAGTASWYRSLRSERRAAVVVGAADAPSVSVTGQSLARGRSAPLVARCGARRLHAVQLPAAEALVARLEILDSAGSTNAELVRRAVDDPLGWA